MFIGIARFEMFIPAARSLKDKRQVLRSATSTVQRNFPAVAIAEVDHQDLWQRSALGVACVSAEGGHCRQILQEVERSIARSAVGGGEIVERDIRVVTMEDL